MPHSPIFDDYLSVHCLYIPLLALFNLWIDRLMDAWIDGLVGWLVGCWVGVGRSIDQS